MFKKKQLISIIESIKSFKNPRVDLEQYTTDAVSTADFLYFVGIDNNDLTDNIVIDLGAGTGRLGLSSLLLGAKCLIAIECDPNAMKILHENALNLGFSKKILIMKIDVEKYVINKINWNESIKDLRLEIGSFGKKFESKSILPPIDKHLDQMEQIKPEKICIMNPPFGFQKRNADRHFLKLGMAISDKIYSIHLSNEKNRRFIKKFVCDNGWRVDSIHSQQLNIGHIYSFHRKSRKLILSDIYKILPELQ